jgi:hypothetical protein
MIFVRSIAFDGPSLEGAGEPAAQMIERSTLGCTFDVSPSSEGTPAGFAVSNGIIGWVVGERDDGSPTFFALRDNVQPIVGHNPIPADAS